MIDIPTCPRTSAHAVAPWQGPRETVRLALPVDGGHVVTLGAVRPGWTDLTDDRGVPRLPLRGQVPSRKRSIRLATGVSTGFAAAVQDEVLTCGTGAPSRRLTQELALDCLPHALGHGRRALHTFGHADGWNRWRGHAERATTTKE